MAELLGIGQCVIRGCTSKKARFTLSSAGLAVCTDKGKGGCQMQAFARDEEADELFRDCLRSGEAGAVPAAQPAANLPANPVRETVQADPVRDEPEPTSPPVKRRVHTFGVLAGQEY